MHIALSNIIQANLFIIKSIKFGQKLLFESQPLDRQYIPKGIKAL